MNKFTLQTFAQVFCLFFLSILVSYGFTSLTSIPAEGDSLAYHIPIARSVLNGHVFHPDFYLGYYPGNAEVVLALFYFLHIPANLFNILGLIILFFAGREMAERFGLQKNLAIIFAVTLCCLPTMLRWTAAQIIDIWLLLFYAWCLLLLQKPQKTISYFLLLGVACGLLLGVKYSGPLFAVGLLIIYFRPVARYLTVKTFVAFFLPVLILGLSWYIRNTMLMHNPIYPQPIFSLQGIKTWNIFDYHEWQIILQYPVKTFNAMLAEYLVWFVAPLIAGGVFLFEKWHRAGASSANRSQIRKLIFLGTFNFLVFLFLPTTPEYNIIVSSIRYSYPAFALFILAMFLYAQARKRETEIIVFSLAGLFFLPALSYRPKLLIIFFVLLFLILTGKKVIIRK